MNAAYCELRDALVETLFHRMLRRQWQSATPAQRRQMIQRAQQMRRQRQLQVQRERQLMQMQRQCQMLRMQRFHPMGVQRGPGP